jgi:hypothetical protein
MKVLAVLCTTLLLASAAFGQKQKHPEPVPNSETAIKVGEAALMKVYGKRKVKSERPFSAELKDDVWTVSGTLHCPDHKAVCHGGVAEVLLSKTDGRVISIRHYK